MQLESPSLDCAGCLPARDCFAIALKCVVTSTLYVDTKTPTYLFFFLSFFLFNQEAVVVCLSSLLKSGHCLEMLSLLAIHFHTNQISSAIELIRETLGLTVAIHSESLNQVG